MTAAEEPVRLDLKGPVFQRQLFGLPKDRQWAVLRTLRKLSGMTWNQVHRDGGLKWEQILSRSGPHGSKLYSLRVDRGFRAVACRDGSWLRILSLHPDHDSAYSGR
ncbi:MAG: hypothetical protein SCH98_16200 [Deferrisomatales bacterium]|nr:hypothetical protein [Deferrisomatales bacterium]